MSEISLHPLDRLTALTDKDDKAIMAVSTGEGSATDLAEVKEALEVNRVVDTQTPSTGFSIAVATSVDTTVLLTPLGTLATGTFSLPGPNDAKVGQVVRVNSTGQVTAATVNVTSSGTVFGTAVTQFAANTTYAWVCTAVTDSANWLRLY